MRVAVVQHFILLTVVCRQVPSLSCSAFVYGGTGTRCRSCTFLPCSSSTEGNGNTSTSTLGVDAVSKSLLEGILKMKKCMTKEFFHSCPSLKQLHNKCASTIEVRESPIAGKGLFCTKNIKSGTIISFYPAHALGLELDNTELFVSECEEYFENHPHATSPYLHATDQPIFKRSSLLGNDTPLYLDVNPDLEVDPLWVSQYINDGAKMEDASVEGITNYYASSKSRKNCIHVPFGPSPILATVATRKIKKGEELLTSYGCTYWLGSLESDAAAAAATSQIQAQIKESAQDLFKAMNGVNTVYASQQEALVEAFCDIEL